MHRPSIIEPLDHIIILAGALDPTPEVILLKLVLVAQLQDTGLKGDDLLGGQRLAQSVGVLEF